MRSLLLFISFITLAGTSFLFPGCANIVPPSGGFRDSLPPELQRSEPLDSTRNFNRRTIQFSFDEYVELQNASQEVLVSPTPRVDPQVDYRLNTVTVRLRDSLEPNTTYTINFGNAIKDINEGNILKNYVYTFSTGTYIDSLEFRGKVLLAETSKPDSTLIVMLHSSPDDSAVVKEKPRYVAKVDRDGNFVFRNLPPRTYYVYALKDEGGQRRYLDEKQTFAFAGAPITISDTTKPIVLFAYSGEAGGSQPIIPNISIGRTPRGERPNADRRLRFTTNLVSGQQDLLGEFFMNFEQPLKVYDSTKVKLFTDTAFVPVTNFRMVKDSTNRSLQLITPWKENTLYQLVIDRDFAEDSLGRKLLKTDTIEFKTRRLAEYGELKIRFRNLDIKTNPVAQFVLNGVVSKSYPLTSLDLAIPTFLPGEYELRILLDANKNGKWDPGEFFNKHLQPERVIPIERKIIVRANFTNEVEIAL